MSTSAIVVAQADPAPHGVLLLCPPPAVTGGGGISLGHDATEAAAEALMGHLGLSVTASWDVAQAGTADYYLWSGAVPGDDAGRYWIPALYRSADLPQVVAGVAEAKGISRAEAATRVQEYHSGLVDDRVALSIAAAVEIDHLPRAEQVRRYAALTAATGLQWALQAHSGGKSVHAYLSFDRPLDPKDPLREEIQHLLIATLEGDDVITSPGHLMRLPGFDGPARKQPVLHTDAAAHYSPEAIRDRLVAYAEALGIADVGRAVRVLRLAHDLDLAARKTGGEAADEIREHASLLRATRGDPATADLDLAQAMLGGRGPVVTVKITGTGTQAAEPVTVVSDEDFAPWRGLPVGSRTVGCPLCGGGNHRRTAAVVRTHGVRCHRCDVTVVPAGRAAGVLPAGVTAIGERVSTSILAPSVADTATGIGPEVEAIAWARDALRSDVYAATLASADARDAALGADAERLYDIMWHCAHVADTVYLPRVVRHLGLEAIRAARRSTGPCGTTLGMVNRATLDGGIYRRGCRSSSCPTCGPARIAMQAAMLGRLPVATHGTISAPTLGGRTLYAYTIPVEQAKSLERLIDSQTAKDSSGYPLIGGDSSVRGLTTEESPPISTQPAEITWVTFRNSNGTRTVVTDRPLTPPRRYRGGKVWLPAPEVIPSDRATDWLADRAIGAYRMTTDPITGMEITGRISTSRGLTIDPQSGWTHTRRPVTVHDRHVAPLDEATAAAGTAGVETTPVTAADDTGETTAVQGHATAVRRSTRTVGVAWPVTAQTTAAAVGALWQAVHREPQVPDAPVVQSLPDMDAALDSFLEG